FFQKTSHGLIFRSHGAATTAGVAKFYVISRAFSLYMAQVGEEVRYGSKPFTVGLGPIRVHLRANPEGKLLSEFPGSLGLTCQPFRQQHGRHGAGRLICMGSCGDAAMSGAIAHDESVQRPARAAQANLL